MPEYLLIIEKKTLVIKIYKYKYMGQINVNF
jgi:hypothetical protein